MMDEGLNDRVSDFENTLCRDRFPNGQNGEQTLYKKNRLRPDLLRVFSTTRSELSITNSDPRHHGF